MENLGENFEHPLRDCGKSCILIRVFNFRGDIIQLVERLNGIEKVRGSTPLISTILTGMRYAVNSGPLRMSFAWVIIHEHSLGFRGRWSESFKAADGRLLSDGDYAYSYPSKTSVSLRNALGETATHDYDPDVGVYRVRDFAGRETKTYFFMRIDAAYYGKVRLVEDAGERRDLVSFRYDRRSGKLTTVKDRLGNRSLPASRPCGRPRLRLVWN